MAAVQAAMNPFMLRLDALERVSMPPPPTQRTSHSREHAAARVDIGPAGPSRITAPTPALSTEANTLREDQGFTTVKRRNRRRKGGTQEGHTDPAPLQNRQVNLTPASYAGVATAAANVKQSVTASKTQSGLPSITEVTVLRTGGHVDPLLEQRIRGRAADAIVRDVKRKMASAVANPIPLRAGRWSVHPRSKGNFVYSFNGHIPFDIIFSYEHILLDPFYGSGQLRPSLGWTRILVHGVPVLNNDDVLFGPDALLTEARSLPGLRKVFFAMAPRWLKPVGEIASDYSTITFAISDPDGSTLRTLMEGRAALFSKEVKIQKWIDKLALVQCSRCHALGHNRASRACPLSKDSVKCYICGGTHKSEEHNQKCPRKHAVAGICDCTNYKCINCEKPGHHCREEKCPARARFRPRHTRRAERALDKGKGRDPAEGPGLPPARATIEEVNEQEYDLFNPPPPPPNVIPEPADSNDHQTAPQDMDIDGAHLAGQASNPNLHQRYSPSHPQTGAAAEPVP
jgi:hypothetical protein